jgi:hypothetical protein
MMRGSRPHRDRWHGPTLRRLERAAGDINPFLILIVIGLAILNFSVFTALEPAIELRRVYRRLADLLAPGAQLVANLGLGPELEPAE